MIGITQVKLWPTHACPQQPKFCIVQTSQQYYCTVLIYKTPFHAKIFSYDHSPYYLQVEKFHLVVFQLQVYSMRNTYKSIYFLVPNYIKVLFNYLCLLNIILSEPSSIYFSTTLEHLTRFCLTGNAGMLEQAYIWFSNNAYIRS
jgi:hypothetical protein